MDTAELRKAQKDTDTSGDEVQVVEFILGDDTFAVNLFDVREIVESIRITPSLMWRHILKGLSISVVRSLPLSI